MKTYYEVLGVPQDATLAEIKQAYRRIARETHPDRSDNPDPKCFKEATDAYDVLRFSHSREMYDHELSNRLNEDPFPEASLVVRSYFRKSLRGET